MDELDPEIPDFEQADTGDDGDSENISLKRITSTTNLIDIDEEEEETSFIDKEKVKEQDEQYDKRREALQFIKRIFPDFKPLESSFTARWDNDGNLKVKLSNQSNAVEHTLIDKDGVINYDNLPKNIKQSLGISYEKIIGRNDELVSKLKEANEKIKDLSNALNGLVATAETNDLEIQRYIANDKEKREFIEKQQLKIAENQSYLDVAVKQKIEAKTVAEKLQGELNRYKDELDKNKKGLSNLRKLEQSRDRLISRVNELEEMLRNQIISNEDKIADLERRNESIIERLPLRERVKAIFKKYGFTVFAVVSAVGVVIGVIVSNLSKGLNKLGKGVGNGFKTIGKKLGEILPGMVGAIVSFLFKTAGEVIGFLSKNAWLLIVAVVLYFVEQFKKKGR